MKKLFILAALIAAVLTGCVSAQYHVKVNRDGSVDLEYHMAMDPSLTALSGGEDPIQEAKSKAEKEGYAVTNYTEDDMVGFKATKHLKNIKDFSLKSLIGDAGQAAIQKDALTVKKGLFMDIYKLNSNIDLSSMKQTGEYAEMTNMMLAKVKLQFTLTLPVKPKTSNAGNITDNGKTLEWKLIAGQNNELNVEANVPNMVNIIIACIIIVGILAVIIIALMLKRKKTLDSTEIKDTNEAKLEE